MKNVTVNIQIQFDVDSDTEEQIKNEVIDKLNSMSQTLARYHMESDPVIFTNSLDSSDIEIQTPEDEILMCEKYPDSEALPDEDGNCSLCGGNCVDE